MEPETGVAPASTSLRKTKPSEGTGEMVGVVGNAPTHGANLARFRV
jgi:hypothetical protein